MVVTVVRFLSLMFLSQLMLARGFIATPTARALFHFLPPGFLPFLPFNAQDRREWGQAVLTGKTRRAYLLQRHNFLSDSAWPPKHTQ
jgi:hypothetical protein